MKTINRKNSNTLDCDCGNVIEFEKEDFVLQQTDESTPFYAIGVKCPDCGCLHVVNPDKFDSKDLLSNISVRGVENTLNDLTFAEIKDLSRMPECNLKVGEAKDITLKNGFKAVLEIIGVRHDSDCTGRKFGVTFCFRELYGTNEDGGKCMNETNTNKGGWDKCDMRKYLNKEFFNLLPDELQELIIPVRKSTYNANRNKASVTIDKVFLPSEYEVFGEAKYSEGQEGEQYEFFKNWRNRIKGYADGEYGRCWWLRSPCSGYYNNFCCVNNNGNANNNNANNTYGVSPCFAI